MQAVLGWDHNKIEHPQIPVGTDGAAGPGTEDSSKGKYKNVQKGTPWAVLHHAES